MMYKTAFDISQTAPIDWRVTAVCVALILSGAVLVAARKQFATWALWPMSFRKFATPFAVVYLAIVVIISAGIVRLSMQSHKELIGQLNSTNAKVVEGRVSQFVSSPYSGHADERFCVQGSCFSYSDYVLTGGFNRTSSHGGPIREGLPVRVTYFDNTILKLEIGEVAKSN
jgi:hypothetical protein